MSRGSVEEHCKHLQWALQYLIVTSPSVCKMDLSLMLHDCSAMHQALYEHLFSVPVSSICMIAPVNLKRVALPCVQHHVDNSNAAACYVVPGQSVQQGSAHNAAPGSKSILLCTLHLKISSTVLTMMLRTSQPGRIGLGPHTQHMCWKVH